MVVIHIFTQYIYIVLGTIEILFLLNPSQIRTMICFPSIEYPIQGSYNGHYSQYCGRVV